MSPFFHALRNSSNYFIDTHCHLWHPEFSQELTYIIEKATAQGVKFLINVGVDPTSNFTGLKLSRRFKNLFTTIGFHPHFANKYQESYNKKIFSLLKKKKVVAIGEIGLDYYRNLSNRKTQRSLLKIFLKLAQDLPLPVIIHNRDAEDDILDILGKYQNIKSIILHCFSSSAQFLKEALRRGYYISFAGNFTYDERLKRLAKDIPVDCLLCESDAPYLAPASQRGKRNEPCYLPETVWHLAQAKSLEVDELKRIIAVTVKRIFGLGSISLKPSFVYEHKGRLYINLTNRCDNSCSFCLREKSEYFYGYKLRLDKEPTVHDVISKIKYPENYEEIVFCGYGEPLIRLKELKEIAYWLKKHRVKSVRVVTNGEANLFHNRNILPELKGLVDKFSISLNFLDAESYNKLCQPKYGEKAYPAIVDFIKKARSHFEVEITFLKTDDINELRCQKLANELAVAYRMRELQWYWD